MLTVTILVPILLLVGNFLHCLISLFRNIRIAKTIGIPYVIVPVYAYNRLNSILFGRTILRFCDTILPSASNISWRRLTGTAWSFKLKHAPFADLKTDTFLTVAPGGIILYTADAEVIAQVNARGYDFPKATHLYKHVDIYGKNVVSSEGAVWRRHRSVTSSAFSEQNHKLVWKETLRVTQSLLDLSWISAGDEPKTIRTVASDAMRLSLEVIGSAGLGEKIEWSKAAQGRAEAKVVPIGHILTFTEALQFVLTHIFYIIAIPMWLLRHSPTKKLQRCHQSYIEWGEYLKEMIASKRAAIDSKSAYSRPSTGVDLISQLLKAQALSDEKDPSVDQMVPFNDSDVMGNLFMFILAGHETSANSIHFSIILLAMHPQVQRKVQNELETILRDRPVSRWSYDTDLKPLLSSLLAAVLNEQLRLLGPVIAIPKITNHQPQKLIINNQECKLPADTNIRLCVASVHHNPKYWLSGTSAPSLSSSNTNPPRHPVNNDLQDFKPERWLKPSPISSTKHSELQTPPKGAFIPFSDGQRACLGKRFAQIEILAALAVIFSQYSVELAVDEWADEKEVAAMDEAEKKVVWEKARSKAEGLLRDKVSCILTLQLRGAHVPVRFVRKGEERFGDL